MHVYADTWAHQGFAGVWHKINMTEDVSEQEVSGLFDKLMTNIRDVTDDIIPPLGHGQAGTFPDMPYLKWQYVNGNDELIERDNTEDFVEAANHMCMAMQRYILKDAHADVTGLSVANQEKFREKFKEFKSDDGILENNLRILDETSQRVSTSRINFYQKNLRLNHDELEESRLSSTEIDEILAKADEVRDGPERLLL